MQFSRYIMQRTSLQMRFEDSNFNIFHPFLRNTDVISTCSNTIAPLRYARCTFSLRFKLRFARFHQVFLWKHHCSALLRKVYYFSKFELRFAFIKCFCGNTIASLSLVFAKKTMQRHPPTLPYRLQYSTIGRPGLNHRVRNENGCVPRAHRHR